MSAVLRLVLVACLLIAGGPLARAQIGSASPLQAFGGGGGGGGGGGTVSSVAAGTGLTGGTITTTGTVALDLTRANTWAGLQSLNGGVNTTDANGYQLGGTGTTLNTFANTVSPILPQSAANQPLSTALYFNQPLAGGYAVTLNSSSANTYAAMIGDNLTINGTVTTHWGEGQTGVMLICGTAPCTLSGELNNLKTYAQIGTGVTISSGENYEGGLDNQGTLTAWETLLSAPENDTTGTVSNYIGGLVTYYDNANTAPGSVFGYAGVRCKVAVGAGTAATYNFCLRNEDATAAIVTAGNMAIGSLAIPTTNTLLKVTGNDTSSGSLVFQIQNSTPANLLYVTDDGSVHIPLSTLYLGANASVGGTLELYGSSSGNAVLTAGTTGVLTSASPVTFSNATITLSGLSSGTVVSGSYVGLDVSNHLVLGAGGGIPAVPTTVGSGTGNTLTGAAEYFICTTTCTVTPPVPAAGDQFCVWNDDNVSTVITMGAIGSSALYENTARTAYGTAGTGTLTSGGAVGDKICIVGRDATHYQSLSYLGTWTAS